MKLISNAELAQKTDAELAGLFGNAVKALPRTARCSAGRRNLLASMENIERELHGRRVRPLMRAGL